MSCSLHGMSRKNKPEGQSSRFIRLAEAPAEALAEVPAKVLTKVPAKVSAEVSAKAAAEALAEALAKVSAEAPAKEEMSGRLSPSARQRRARTSHILLTALSAATAREVAKGFVRRET